MKRFLHVLFAVLVLICSCSGNEFSVQGVDTGVYVSRSSNEMGLYVYVRTDSLKEEHVSFEVTNPSGNLTWTVNAKRTELDGQIYYGSSDIRMPATSILDKGKWKLSVISADGSTEDFYFDVEYSYSRSVDITGMASGQFYKNLNVTIIDD